ncbi:Dihydrolipoyllysine-residue acetyltransferase [Elsinoe australis]|uniref:Dihydrolipoamide acetyltransferase component of pyruvate dehydrogenase complex n=1 Tax=Elsinoe australis TaxID=40998 RepID=A0A2P8A4B7_9PEZI|nr:Dihydrolipoyllysine-residue acetyltransferase [Elsinoe australis]
MVRYGLFTLLAVFFSTFLASASLFLPFLEGLEHRQDSLSDIDSNTTRASENEEFDLEKRQTVSSGCPNGYSSCAGIGAAQVCCGNNAICTADNAGYVACCPVGAVCTGTVTGVITSGTIPPGGSASTARTTNVLTGSTSATTTGLFSSATSNNGLIVASGSVTASASNGGFIISGGQTVASPAGANKGAQVPWVAEMILAIIQWFVQPGARVEQFDKICEVQSDKTATDITSPFDGVIKKLHYEADDMAIVGKPLVDIDIQSEITPQDEAKLGGNGGAATTSAPQETVKTEDKSQASADITAEATPTDTQSTSKPPSRNNGQHKSLATPAVRHLTKELKVNIEDIEGTGKDGRVTKEDVHNFANGSSATTISSSSTSQQVSRPSAEDRKVPLTPVQSAMFKTMTRSLTIPHFLYTMTVDMSSLTQLRSLINASRDKSTRITPLPFILKAVSLAFNHHPLLNAHLDTSDPKKPQLTYRGTHDFGIAVDTPQGLIVPVIRNVQSQSVAELAASIKAASEKAQSGKLASVDMQGGTFTVSNIGSIGGGVVAPIIVEPQVGIVGVGRSKVVPAFDENGELVKREELVLSWSADHRVVDGAECARAAERVKRYLEGVGEWVLELR